ncbi:hypothetical protein DYB28_004108, partial [Aphanomyces astaci]
GKWNPDAGTAAGCSNYGQYLQNPQYLLHVPPSGQLPDATANPTTAFLTSAKGAYTNSTCGVRTPLAHVPPGYYLVIPSTFEPRRGDFDLHGYANLPVTTSRLR